MSALSAASVIRENVGSLTLHIVNFTAAVADDTYASGLGTNVVSFWANSQSMSGSTLNAGCNVKNASGTFTFQNNPSAAVNLFIVSKS